MDTGPEGYEGYSGSGFRRINRIVAKFDGETHIYQYPPGELQQAVSAVKRHVEEGQLHPYAGLMVVKMMREVGDED